MVGDLSGVVHGVNAKDGKGIWTFAASSEVKASPVIVDGKVIIGSYDGNLYALGLKDGKVVWQFRTNGPVHATASVAAGSRLYFRLRRRAARHPHRGRQGNGADHHRLLHRRVARALRRCRVFRHLR